MRLAEDPVLSLQHGLSDVPPFRAEWVGLSKAILVDHLKWSRLSNYIVDSLVKEHERTISFWGKIKKHLLVFVFSRR